ncbi:carbamoyltransferase [Ferruginibacter yonginensis]|uniref:Carbamoyltransferase n=1 Tax=Ferruginibacter yonginensis TaxID=1310416 RepID=A0ABV8QTA6_9BACT
MNNAPIYILGTGLSHDGSTCLLKDGKLVVAIEKERLTRIKHDGGNDYDTVQYCLDAAGITLNEVSLVVQCANFEKHEILPNKFKGKRLFTNAQQPPIFTISHHLAHAYSALGTSPFETCAVMIIDGCGSFYHQSDDLVGAFIPATVQQQPGLYGEKDSFYYYDGVTLQPIFKDFSIIDFKQQPHQVYLPTSNHSIGGLYAMASNYCFGDFDDVGKLMGLAPYGRKNIYTDDLFILKDDTVWVNETVMHQYFTQPMDPIDRPFNDYFQYYADIAYWVQTQATKAILYVFQHRLPLVNTPNICYAGGVALNAVANAQLLKNFPDKNFYIEPAAGDNGLAIGCAYYGWLSVLGKPKVLHNGSTFLGKTYFNNEIEQALKLLPTSYKIKKVDDVATATIPYLLNGKTIAWFQGGAEFGPRALGKRSIIADPRIKDIQQYINGTIKCREDFRPFAPSVLYDYKDVYFEDGFESPYMILVDKIKPSFAALMPGIVHVDGSCRVQTVTSDNEPYYSLLKHWYTATGIAVLLNTSLNKKGMPIVETPHDIIHFFMNSAIEVLVLHQYIITKHD